MRKIFLLWLLMVVGCISYAQTITIKDKATGEPIEMVQLVSEEPEALVYTNAKGRADISAFINSEKIQIVVFGYESLTKSYKELEESGFVIFLAEEDMKMDEVIISANRSNQHSKDLPVKVISIKPKDVALQNPQTAADMLGSSGKVFIQKSQQGGGSPMIRGFSTNRLLYAVDGVRMNTAIFRGGNLQNVISLDPFATEKAEVLFGPGSVMYGSDAIGGVMTFQTLTPRLSYEDKPLITGKAVTRYSSANNEKTGHFDINVGWKKWALVTSFTSNDFGDLRMGTNGPDEYLRPFYVQRVDSADVVVANDNPYIQRPTGYTQINLMQKVRFAPNDKWDFQYGFHYSTTSSYSRYDRHIRYRNGLPRYGEWSYGPQKWMMNNLNVTHNGNNKVYDQLTIRLAHQFFEESRISRDINKNNREIREEEVNAYSVNLDFSKNIGKRHQFFYGLEGVQNDVKSIGIDENIKSRSTAPGPARYPQSTWASYAAYLSYQLKLTEKVTVQTGARYSQVTLDALFDTTFYPFPYTTAKMNNGALTGSLGAVYKVTDKFSVSANASTGFRSPNVDDAGKVFDSEPGSVVVPNPDLKSEYAYNAEVGVAKMFGNIVKLDVAAYYTYLKDALVRRDFTLNGQDSIMYDGELSKVQAIQNAANANVYGIQAGITIKLPAGFEVSSDINYQKGEEELDDGSKSPSRHAPPMFGVTKLTYSANKLNMQLYAVYSGAKKFEDLPEEEKGKTEIYAKDVNGKPWSPSWYTLNFKAMYQFAENYTISAGVENITDQLYRPYSSGIAAAGRNFVLSLRANF
ncbi:MAG TPA: TonB-dependent receptor [Cytophagaceae bacterium]